MLTRESVLKVLQESNGDWISPAVLSKISGLPEAEIEDLVKELLALGYELDSSPERGYRLVALPDRLSPEAVVSGLTTRIFGRTNYIYYTETDSTNTRAQALAAEGYPEGTVVVAETQTTGKGRRGRAWYSPALQGIYMTVILRPTLPVHEISRISLVIAVAAAEALEAELNLPARIKWPNDILIGHKKIAGILSETAVDTGGIKYIVTGIGLNINNPIESFPDGLRTAPTSALAEQKGPVSRVKVLQSLLARLEYHYFYLLEGKFTDTLEKGKSLSLVLGQEVRFDTIEGSATGIAVDLDDDGSLLVRDEAGCIHTVTSGEISVFSGA